MFAFSKVVELLGEQYQVIILGYMQAKYGSSIFSIPGHSITLQEIKDTVRELFPIGGDLIIRMLEAELDLVQ